MPHTLMNGVRVPQGGDQSAPQVDMRLLGGSVRTILIASSAAEAAGAVNSARTELGWEASNSAPIFVYRTDTGTIMMWNGARWTRPSGNTHTGSRMTSPAGAEGRWDAFAGRTIEVARATVTPDQPCRAVVFGQVQARPAGNASGVLYIEMYGNTVKSWHWHSQGSSSHQWPALMCAVTLKAERTDIRLMHRTGDGSASTVVEFGTLDVEVMG